MTPSQARAFLAVATEGSFTAAARRLAVSQPTVTSQVGDIEKQYNVELFHRTGRGARLTPAGAVLLPVVRRMFASFEEALACLEDFREMRQGHLRIGAYGPYDVAALVARHKKRFPALSISVDIANSSTLAEKLLNCELDVALLDQIEAHPEFEVLPFQNPLLVVIAPRTEPWLARRSISIEELRKQILVCRESGSATRAAFDRVVGLADMPAHRLLEFGSREGVVSAVAQGAGLGAMFDEGALAENRVIKLSIKDVSIVSKVDLVWLGQRRTSRVISDFLDAAREYLKSSGYGAQRRMMRRRASSPVA
jgi:LysR family transcriptional regulator, low CO2-responsive transcriptional regulator